MTGDYALEGGQSGKQRLDVLARVCAPYTNALLDRVGVPTDARCVDVGCGGGHVSQELARRASRGSVVGIDLDQTVLDLAAEASDDAGLTNLEFRHADATQLEAATYDVIYARFLLRHVPNPAAVVAVMTEALKQGGALILEDNDFRGYLWHPPSTSLERYVNVYRETVSRHGGDPDIGPTLPSLLITAGLQNVQVDAYQACGLQGDVKLITPLTLERIATTAVADRIATEDELMDLSAQLHRYAADPATLLSLPRVIQTWGRQTASHHEPKA